jgi:hypothetical protein
MTASRTHRKSPIRRDIRRASQNLVSQSLILGNRNESVYGPLVTYPKQKKKNEYPSSCPDPPMTVSRTRHKSLNNSLLSKIGTSDDGVLEFQGLKTRKLLKQKSH